jgi:hypothetical protein
MLQNLMKRFVRAIANYISRNHDLINSSMPFDTDKKQQTTTHSRFKRHSQKQHSNFVTMPLRSE